MMKHITPKLQQIPAPVKIEACTIEAIIDVSLTTN